MRAEVTIEKVGKINPTRGSKRTQTHKPVFKGNKQKKKRKAKDTAVTMTQCLVF